MFSGEEMSIKILRGDITAAEADAIVNSANTDVAVGRGVDMQIYRAAGYDRLFAEREKIGVLAYGQTAVTPAFGLNARYIFHTVAPKAGHEEILSLCYRGCIDLAARMKLDSIAFPLLGAGSNGIDANRTLEYAVDILRDTDIEVQIYISERLKFEADGRLAPSAGRAGVMRKSFSMETEYNCAPSFIRSLDSAISEVSETFQETLLRMIDERGLKDPEVYHRANISRKHFSKIRSSRDYHPGKKTVLSFAIALELSLDETVDLLARAGYAFSPSSREDSAIRYFIQEGIYDIYDINVALFEHGLEPLI